MEYSGLYNKEYYATGLGEFDYHDKNRWELLFKRTAQHIADDLCPKTVLDVGCAFGYMVEYLRELGIEAWGIDVSQYAISQGNPNIKEYLRVVAAEETLPKDMPQTYDLVLNIEVLEHLYEEECERVLENMCSYSDKILFSSTGTDFEEPTHVNVQQSEYWAEKFAQRGFFRKVDYSVDYLSVFAAVYEKRDIGKAKLVRNYEHKLRFSRYDLEKEQKTNAKLVSDLEIVRAQKDDISKYYENEVQRLNNEVQLLTLQGNELERLSENVQNLEKVLIEKQNQIKSMKAEANERMSLLNEHIEKLSTQKKTADDNFLTLKNEVNQLKNARGYKALIQYYKVRDKLLPKGSYRRRAIKKASYFLIKKKNDIAKRKLHDVKNGEQNSEARSYQEFYSVNEKKRQQWCRDNPIAENIKFSIVVPLYNTPVELLEKLVFSVKDQIYENWELCLVNASVEKTTIRHYVEQVSVDCNKIKYKELEENQGISGNTIEAIRLAEGDFIALLDHDDMIAPNALYEYALHYNQHPEVEFFYSDKDMINEEGTERMNHLYKPELSPEMMLSANYLTHFCAIKKAILEKTAGFDKTVDGAQDWDIFLKVMEKTIHIKRIPQILYHWRIIATSVASGIDAKPYVLDAQLKCLNSYIDRKGWKGNIYFADREKSKLKVEWAFLDKVNVAVIIYSESGTCVKLDMDSQNVFYLSKDYEKMQNKIAKIDADVLIFIDGDEVISISDNLVEELAMWATHPDIAFVIPQVRIKDKIKSCGLVYEKDQVFDLFGDKHIGFYGEMGGSEWYRNFSISRGTCIAVEKNKWLKFQGCKRGYNTLAISYNCLVALELGYRNVYNHFAHVEASTNITSINDISADFFNVRTTITIKEEDSYFNGNCIIDINRSAIDKNCDEGTKNIEQIVPLDKYTTDALVLADAFDFTQKDLEKNLYTIRVGKPEKVQTMVWFLQEFDYVFYAGLYTIFRTAEYLRERHGVKHTFVFLTNLDAKTMLDRIGEGFPELQKCKGISIQNTDELSYLDKYDASVCTLWTTAYCSLKFNKVNRKFYFIQDYEPLFYPGGSTYAQTEATYRFGFYGIANTFGLKEMYEREYGGKAVSLDPSVDTKIFYPNTKRQYDKKTYTVFFYGRPGHSRNGFELGVAALKKLKARMGNKVRIITAGASYNTTLYGLDGIVENLGRLPIEETGELYRNCDAGLVMMYTRHPSYLPYEMMACGCCVVSNYNAYTSWFLKDGENSIVCEPSATSIAESMEGILKDEDRRKQISTAGAKQLMEKNPDWDVSLEKVAQFIHQSF